MLFPSARPGVVSRQVRSAVGSIQSFNPENWPTNFQRLADREADHAKAGRVAGPVFDAAFRHVILSPEICGSSYWPLSLQLSVFGRPGLRNKKAVPKGPGDRSESKSDVTECQFHEISNMIFSFQNYLIF
jgi:hypothetical protein